MLRPRRDAALGLGERAGIALGELGFVSGLYLADVPRLSLAAGVYEWHAVDDDAAKIRESHFSFLSAWAQASSAAQVD